MRKPKAIPASPQSATFGDYGVPQESDLDSGNQKIDFAAGEAAVTVTIPGAKSVRQAQENAAASDLPALSPQLMERIADIYERRIKPAVHQRW